MRGDNLEVEPVRRRNRILLPDQCKIMLSVSEETYLALAFEAKDRGLSSIQEIIRLVLSEWYRVNKFSISTQPPKQSLVER
jgi:hypothetical protein